MKSTTLDLGSDTGFTVMDGQEIIESGTFHLATDQELEQQRREGKDRTLDIRFVRFYEFLDRLVRSGVRRIVFEDVGFVSTRMQTQLWASLRCVIWILAMLHPKLAVYAVPVGTLKQFAAGNVRANKADMAKALADRLPELYKLQSNGFIVKPDGSLGDDDEVDAIWLALYTRAVDAGQRTFLTVYQRKRLKELERRKKRAERKARAKAKKAAIKELKLKRTSSAKQ